MVRIHALQKTTLQDFPGKIAAIVFLAGCNMRCVYCHNPAAVNGKPNLSEKEFFCFLDSRKGKLQGVVVSGGEPTVHPDLVDFVSKIKSRGFAVKLDTNGARPDMVKELIEKKLLDYIAMDVKAPFSKYPAITGAHGLCCKLKRSIQLIKKSGVDYEFRTTCHPSLSRADLLEIAEQVRGAKRFFLQQYVEEKTLDPQRHLVNYSTAALESFRAQLAGQFQEIEVR